VADLRFGVRFARIEIGPLQVGVDRVQQRRDVPLFVGRIGGAYERLVRSRYDSVSIPGQDLPSIARPSCASARITGRLYHRPQMSPPARQIQEGKTRGGTHHASGHYRCRADRPIHSGRACSARP
jgi:hypothetical protein